MATAILKRTRPYGPESAGIVMTPREFDRAEFVEGWRYELINGVLVVSPARQVNERDPNQELGHWLLLYQETHPKGSSLDFTIPEHDIKTRQNRRRADRVIWAGFRRFPRQSDKPTIIVEFVSSGKRDRRRDYIVKRKEYLEIGVREYWVIDRFQRRLTVFSQQGKRAVERVIAEKETYRTDLLPGFELPVKELLACADRWPEPEPEEW